MAADNQRFVIDFGDGQAAFAIRVPADGDMIQTMETLDLVEPRPVIVVVGGASAMAAEDMDETRPLIADGLNPFAEERGAAIVDGATDTGVMLLLAETRLQQRRNFALIGVAPTGPINYPGHENPASKSALHRGHSHFVLIEAEKFGMETTMMAQIAQTLSGFGLLPVVALLVNGGRVARQDAHLLATSQGLKMPLIVLDGSGRFADELAAAMRAGSSDDETIAEILADGDVYLISVDEGADGLRKMLDELFEF